MARLAAFLLALITRLAWADGPALQWIDAVVNEELRAGRIPGAVVLVGTRDEILYRKAFGSRAIQPRREALAPDTVFDLASLTKVVATAPAVMQLVERGLVELDAPASRYWPEFAAHGKQAITVRQLLTHYSGLRAGLDLRAPWTGYDTALGLVVGDKPVARPGEHYLYSDVNFIVLGELVRRVSGMPLDEYCRTRLFAPLGMNASRFRPPESWKARIAPTQDLPGRSHWGDVHDATARWMGGVAGHAGLFSSADDLARYAQALMNGGSRVISAGSVRAMTSVASGSAPRARGLGWDVGGADGFGLFPEGTYGHLGFTGTLLWVDPARNLFAVLLTHRVYPDGKGNADPLRRALVGGLSASPAPAREAAGIRRPAS